VSHTYRFSIQVITDFTHAADVLVYRLHKAGFSVISDVDVQRMLQEKVTVDVGRYRVLSVCNPWVAHEALRAEPDCGLLLPTTIAIREDQNDSVTISFSMPELVFALSGRNDLVMLGKELRLRLEVVCDAVTRELMESPLAVAAD
jgi:uncharacterized protein (DUF302 family)